MRDTVRFRLDGTLHEIQNPDPTLTVLRWLRKSGRTGTKEGCGEGDCGACTVVVATLTADGYEYRALNACILFLPMLDGKILFTVESLARDGLHPVQQAMVDTNGSQCGFCTPGFVMSLYAWQMDGCVAASARDAIAGNLCRCTGYGPILDAAAKLKAAPAPPAAWLEPMPQDSTLAITHVEAHTGIARRFFAPRTLKELAELSALHPDAVFLAGNTDVGLWVTKRLMRLDTIISIASVTELHSLEETADGIAIGAAVSYTRALSALAKLHPDLGEMLRRLGSVQVRNGGTIGGNIANGSPIGDSPPPLIALGAVLTLNNAGTRRTMPLEDFFLAYGRQDRAPGEFVESVFVPKLPADADFRVTKISKRFDQDISAVCGAILIRRDGEVVKAAHIAFGGMAATPRRARAAEAALTGKPFSETTIRAAMAALEQDFTPLTDMRASADYRMKAAQNLLLKAFLEISGAAPQRILSLEALDA